ncbi:unnamed protein product [Durusdinium trenchii]|uniref:Fe2OG dioxygenase domain-containing protein n=1 Tax=Durusdinium trenchii TaxID=1381693 RepID=A0ABP0QP74_9DINO
MLQLWQVRLFLFSEAFNSLQVVSLEVSHVQLKPVSVGVSGVVMQGAEVSATAKPFFVLPQRLSEDLLVSALEEAQRLQMDDHEDEADWLPAYETYVMEKATMDTLDQGLRSAVIALEQAALPLVQKAYDCPTCVSCTGFVRRYLPQERMRVPPHFDITAYATIILPLSPPQNYTGGFFVQPTAHVDSRRFVPLGLGDLVVHDFTLNHGIEVLHGGRYSLILWISETLEACHGSHTPWHAQRARDGDAVAQHLLGMMFSHGNGAPQDDLRALEWTLLAATNGLANAQFSAGTMYFEGKGAPEDYNRSFYWYEKAAEQGDASAQIIVARMYWEGLGSPADSELAAYWYRLGSLQAAKGVALSGPQWLLYS